MNVDKLVKRLLDIIPRYARLPLLLALVWNCLGYYGGRLIAWDLPHFSFALPCDSRIPQLPWTIVIYFLSFLFWTVNYILASRRGEEFAYRFLCADFLTRLVCFSCFVFLPTSMIRPVIMGNSLWCRLLRFIYSVDAADNLFPSIHCVASVLSALGIHGDPQIPRWYRVLSWLFAVAVCISTLTTKQHVFADVIGGIVLALTSYGVAGIDAVSEAYRKLICSLRRQKAENEIWS